MFQNAFHMSWIEVVESTPCGRGFENNIEMKSARSTDISKMALNIRCCMTAWRRISTMNAICGLMAAMYVKFCSGPTPMYTPPLVPRSRSIV